MNYITRHWLKLQFVNPTRSGVTIKLSSAPDWQVSNPTRKLITKHLRKGWTQIPKPGISLSLMTLWLETSYRHQTLGEISLNPTRWVNWDHFSWVLWGSLFLFFLLLKSKGCFLFSLSLGYHHVSAIKCIIWNIHNMNRQLQTALSNSKLHNKIKTATLLLLFE